MALILLNSSPADSDKTVPIDSNIVLTFNKPVELFTTKTGISLYSIGAQTWTGSMLSEKDALTSDVKSSVDQIEVVEFSVAVSGCDVTLTPLSQLKSNTKYYLQISPGTDTSRFLVASTYDAPSYTYLSETSNGVCEIVSPYTGSANRIYQLLLSGPDSFDLLIDGVYEDSFTFVQNEEVAIKDVTVSLSGEFSLGDSISLNLYAPDGLSVISKFSFTTSEYVTDVPKSINIEDKLIKSLADDLKIISTIPASLSTNNTRINPIIIKFNKALDSDQQISDKVRIVKFNIDTGSAKRINHYTKIENNLLKVYMVSVDNLAELSSLPILGIATDSALDGNEYTLIKGEGL